VTAVDPVADRLRVAAALAQCEMALVRHDPVAGALLTQAARHADGMSGAGAAAAAAAALHRAAGEDAAVRKVVQALTRAAVIENDAALLGRPG
jgi:hypothetical protein